MKRRITVQHFQEFVFNINIFLGFKGQMSRSQSIKKFAKLKTDITSTA